MICEECQHDEHEVCASTVGRDGLDGSSVRCGCEHAEHSRVAAIPAWQSVGLPFAAAVLTPMAYLLWLGWHELVKGKSAYEAWQVVGLALTLTLLVMAATWRSTKVGVVVAFVVAVTLTVVWSWDAATTPSKFDDGLWPVGAITLFGGSTIGFAAVLGVTPLVKALWRTRDRVADPLA